MTFRSRCYDNKEIEQWYQEIDVYVNDFLELEKLQNFTDKEYALKFNY